MIATSDKSVLSISVVMCTRNRANLLGRAIASVVGQNFPRSNYEIVIVDNGSTDETPEVVGQFRDSAKLQYLREERIGLCVARNSGWRAATGRYVAFFDDDAIAAPDWLTAIQDAFKGSAPTVGVVGGRVDPIWEQDRPWWLADEIARSLTIVDWGESTKSITNIEQEWLVGANMAVPKEILAEVGGFHPWLDRVGNNLLSSGDVFLQKEIMRHGYQCLYLPAMTVQHLVPTSRLNRRWFERRFYWQGVSDAVMHLIERPPSPAERLRLAIGRTTRLVRSRGKVASVLFRSEQADAFTSKCFALVDVGFVAGILGAAGH